MSVGQGELQSIGDCGQNGSRRAERRLEVTLQVPVGFLKVSSDKAKVFIKPATPGSSTVVTVASEITKHLDPRGASTGGLAIPACSQRRSKPVAES